MNIPTWLVIGVLIGALAKVVTPKSGTIIVPVIHGAVGAVGGGVLGKFAGLYEPTGPGAAAGWMLSVMGAFLLVGVYVTMGGPRDEGDKGS